MPEHPAPTIGCAIGDTYARDLVCRALEAESATIVELEADQLTNPETFVGLAALVYDLAPWNRTALEILNNLRGRPVFVYYPDRLDLVHLVAAAGQLAFVWTRKQLHHHAQEATEIKRHLRLLLDCVPGATVLALLRELLAPLPAALDRFLEAAMKALQAGITRSDCRESCVAASGVGLRRLQQLCQQGNLPQPARLVRWLTYIWLLYGAQLHGVSFADEASLMGFDSKERARLRAQLLPAVPRRVRFDPHEELTFALVTFAEECGLGREHIVRTAGRLGVTVA
jgi:hypothetical protein